MSGNLVHSGTAIGCPHGGRVAPGSVRSSGVRADGLPVLTAAEVFTVSGCRHAVGGVPRPCVSVRWTPGPGGVLVDGVPVLLERTGGMCFGAALVPQGAPVVAPGSRGVSSR
ncbi:hypothetical protein [Streptomyces sp. NPDC001985]|uniref:hypothetical protein n=1 Tax=Streptomyces sp. NPDC001985 TaxID=3154406 RepID=UPI003326BD19